MPEQEKPSDLLTALAAAITESLAERGLITKAEQAAFEAEILTEKE